MACPLHIQSCPLTCTPLATALHIRYKSCDRVSGTHVPKVEIACACTARRGRLCVATESGAGLRCLPPLRTKPTPSSVGARGRSSSSQLLVLTGLGRRLCRRRFPAIGSRVLRGGKLRIRSVVSRTPPDSPLPRDCSPAILTGSPSLPGPTNGRTEQYLRAKSLTSRRRTAAWAVRAGQPPKPRTLHTFRANWWWRRVCSSCASGRRWNGFHRRVTSV